MSNTYVEVRIKACTGEYTLLKCDSGDFLRNKQEAAQIASIISMLVRTGRTVSEFRLTAPEDWFTDFGPDAHIAEVKVSRVRVLDLSKREQDRGVKPIVIRNTMQRGAWYCHHLPAEVTV